MYSNPGPNVQSNPGPPVQLILVPLVQLSPGPPVQPNMVPLGQLNPGYPCNQNRNPLCAPIRSPVQPNPELTVRPNSNPQCDRIRDSQCNRIRILLCNLIRDPCRTKPLSPYATESGYAAGKSGSAPVPMVPPSSPVGWVGWFINHGILWRFTKHFHPFPSKNTLEKYIHFLLIISAQNFFI